MQILCGVSLNTLIEVGSERHQLQIPALAVTHVHMGSPVQVMDAEDSRANFTTNTGRMHHRLKRFVGAGNLKKMALNIIASNLAEEDIGHLRKLFHSIDIDGNGVITLEVRLNVCVSSRRCYQ